MDWMGDNAKQIDAKDAETYFKTKFPILLRDEFVEIVFKSGRDFTVFTNLRLLKVDVKGMTGKKVEFLTIPYGSIDAFAVQTAGKFMDRDTEMKLHLSKLGDYSKITQDFAKDNANLWAIQKVWCLFCYYYWYILLSCNDHGTTSFELNIFLFPTVWTIEIKMQYTHRSFVITF